MRKLPLRMASLLHLMIASLALVQAACTDEGVTPTCVENIDPESGIVKDTEGCHRFPPCIVGGRQVNPIECCKNDKGQFDPMCVYGYEPLPSSSTSKPGATSSSASSSSGTGGEGGAGNGGEGGAGNGGAGGS